MSQLSRRDVLKLAASLAAGSALSRLPLPDRPFFAQPDKPNFLILVFDAMSARNLSAYGYGRNTTPNLARIADRATIYHSHYSAGNFTTAGTASMLMGLSPWTHRGINLGGMVRQPLVERNLFALMKDDYFSAAFTQNFYAHVLLGQFDDHIDRLIPAASFYEQISRPFPGQFLPGDPVSGYYALDEFVFGIHGPRPAPLLDYLDSFNVDRVSLRTPGTAEYPFGLPNNSFYSYRNEVVYEAVGREIVRLAEAGVPYLGYFHLLSPHEPYRPRARFVDIFEDLDFPFKPPHPFSTLDIKHKDIINRRMDYDEQVADVDFEIGRLFDALQGAGVLEDTYLILTSDHGELFERGEYGHVTRLMYDAVLHIPLIVVAPGQSERRDVHALTSNLDLVPTILGLAGIDLPDWLEGRPLPALGQPESDSERSVFSVEAKDCSAFGPLDRGASIAMQRGDMKLIYYSGYPKIPERFELYDLREDPEELQDLYASSPAAPDLRAELLENFERYRSPA